MLSASVGVGQLRPEDDTNGENSQRAQCRPPDKWTCDSPFFSPKTAVGASGGNFLGTNDSVVNIMQRTAKHIRATAALRPETNGAFIDFLSQI